MEKINIYEIVTEQILEIMAQGVIPWKKPWSARGSHRNLVSGKQYRGINVFLLSCSPFFSPWWLTFKQAAEKGGKIRKGEKGRKVVFWKPLLINEENPATGKTEKKKIFMLRYYTIFNLEQVDGIEAPIEPETEKLESIAAAEKIVFEMQNSPVITEAAGNKACYYLSRDEVQMPFFQDFDESEKYYSVLFHEIAHYAVSQIMPCRYCRYRQRCLLIDTAIGIIRVLPEKRATRRWVDIDLSALLLARFLPWLALSG